MLPLRMCAQVDWYGCTHLCKSHLYIANMCLCVYKVKIHNSTPNMLPSFELDQWLKSLHTRDNLRLYQRPEATAMIAIWLCPFFPLILIVLIRNCSNIFVWVFCLLSLPLVSSCVCSFRDLLLYSWNCTILKVMWCIKFSNKDPGEKETKAQNIPFRLVKCGLLSFAYSAPSEFSNIGIFSGVFFVFFFYCSFLHLNFFALHLLSWFCLCNIYKT